MAEKSTKSEVVNMGAGDIVPDKLKQIVRAYEDHKGEMDEARGEIGALLKDAESTHGLHRAAFKQAVKLKNSAPEKCADFLRAFDSYRHILGLDDQVDLFEDAA